MSTATPTKRRALGALDVNVTRSPRSPSSASLSFKPTGKAAGGGSPTKKNKAAAAAAVVAGAGAGAASARHATPAPASSPASSAASAALETMAAQTPKKTKKRPLDAEACVEGAPSPAVKKLCSKGDASSPRPRSTTVEDAEEDQEPPSAEQPTTAWGSMSPEASELFDNSAIANTSQLTNITEPDTESPISASAPARVSATSPAAPLPDLLPLPAPQPRRVMPTREELRQHTALMRESARACDQTDRLLTNASVSAALQRAEILKLRLSLAMYKVKTNQVDVPLEKLQVRPVPGMTPPRRASPLPSMSAHTVERTTPAQYWYRSSRGCGAGARINDTREVKREEEPSSGDVMALPALLSTPRKRMVGSAEADEVEKRLTSSGLRGGAAKGLLSLSQGS